MAKMSPKQKRIAEAKLSGMTNKDIGAVEYPTATAGSRAVLISRELKKPHVAKYIDTGVDKQLEKFNVTKEQYFFNIGLAMQAEKQDQFTGEVRPDIQARLAGNKMAEKYLFKEDEEPVKVGKLPEGIDEVQLIRLLKKDS